MSTSASGTLKLQARATMPGYKEGTSRFLMKGKPAWEWEGARTQAEEADVPLTV